MKESTVKTEGLGCDEEFDYLKDQGFDVFDFGASDVGNDLVEWFDERLRELGYELEVFGEYPVKWYKVIPKEVK